MTAQLGRSVLLKVETSPGGGTFATVGGQRSTGLTINNEIVDVTNKDDAGVRTLLAGAGVNSMSTTISGVFEDDSNMQLVRDSAQANTHLNYQIVFPGSSNAQTFEGAFAIASLEESGEYNGEVTYSITLESAGTITVS
ncbi:MAG: phage major tail protein, TP901-1 family [Candidatus Riesia sp.]|nr:phage major tail protein, TP901-1 family [Candidatus Riesia sp.]